MSQAKSQVQVSIVAQLGQGFSQAFRTADKTITGLSKSVQSASKIVGDVSAYRKQQDAVKQAGYSWQAAKAKADSFREAIAAQGAPTRKQAADLAKLERATERASAAFTKERSALAEMARGLQQAGVNTGKLTDEQARLTKQLQIAQAQHDRAEKSLARQARISAGIARSFEVIQRGAVAVAAVGAVGAMAGRKALPYDEQLSRLADTAINNEPEDPSGKKAKKGDYKTTKQVLADAIQKALDKAGGGSRDDAMGGLSTLIATGGMSTMDASTMLPDVMQGAFATGATGAEVAAIMLKAKQMGVSPKRAIEMAHKGGQMGGVEVPMMAEMLPDQLAQGAAAGYNGERGYAQIIALNQAALSAAGDPKVAANNVKNLLVKLNSQDLRGNIKKTFGVDWDKYALKNQENGIYKAESLAMLAEAQLAKNPQYKALQKKLLGAKSQKEKEENLQAMLKQIEGTSIGALLQDMQALSGALAMVYDRKSGKLAKLDSGILKESAGVVTESAGNFKGEAWAATQRAGEAINEANKQMFDRLAEPIKAVADGMVSLSKEFPALATAAYGAGLALSAIGLTGLLGGAGIFRRGKGAPGVPPSGGPGGASLGLGAVGRMAGVAGIVSWLANGTTSAEDAVLANSQKQRQGLRDKYGSDNVDAAFRAKKPWYIGHQDAASPKDLEGWVKSYMAEKDAAAKAAQNRPNVTNNSTYNLSVTAPPGAGAAELGAQLQKLLRDVDRKREADAKSLMFDNLGH